MSERSDDGVMSGDKNACCARLENEAKGSLELQRVKNDAFDANEQQYLPTISGAVNVMEKNVSKNFLQREQNSGAASEPLTNNHNTDEIDLQMLPAKETYKKLCSCEEEGQICQCQAGVRDGNANLKFESWGRWKNIALITVTALVGIWAVVYITLSQIRVL